MTQKRTRLGKTWVMAVDPYLDFDMSPMRQLSEKLAEQSGAELIAAYVLAPASFNWTGEFSGPWIKKYKPGAEARMEQIFRDAHFHPTVVACRAPGLRSSVKCLETFARKVKAEMIVITTHARTGVDRWVMGSFAETLILSSQVPVLVVNPKQAPPQSIRRILVPADLESKSEKHVKQSALLAQRLGASVVLYFKPPDPLDPMIQQGVYTLGGGWVSVHNFIQENLENRRKQLAKLETMIRKLDVDVHSVIDTTSDTLVEGINAAITAEKADMVTVWTHAGPVAAAILGSVARGLVRTSKVPVLVRR